MLVKKSRAVSGIAAYFHINKFFILRMVYLLPISFPLIVKYTDQNPPESAFPCFDVFS
jgi:hypothetical protein